MKELNKTRRLTVATSLFVIMIVFGLLSIRKAELEYSITTENMVEELFNAGNEMGPDEALNILAAADPSCIFVDVRNSYEYNRGSLENALNIPVSDILDRESMEFFRKMTDDGVMIVFFGSSQRQANGPWMLLKQLGINSVKVLQGGYHSLANNPLLSGDSAETKAYRAEEPALDFASFMEVAGSLPAETKKDEQISIQPVQRKKKSAAAGGC